MISKTIHYLSIHFRMRSGQHLYSAGDGCAANLPIVLVNTATHVSRSMLVL